jgi:hypothetical protein
MFAPYLLLMEGLYCALMFSFIASMPSEGVLQVTGFPPFSQQGGCFELEKSAAAPGMRSHDSTGQEPTLYPLGQPRQSMKGKRKSALYPLARFIHWLLLAVRVTGGIRLQIVYGTDRVSMALFFHLKSSRNRLVT